MVSLQNDALVLALVEQFSGGSTAKVEMPDGDQIAVNLSAVSLYMTVGSMSRADINVGQ